MSYLYINENGAVIGIEENKVVVHSQDGMKRSVPIETLESITIMGTSQMTTQCTVECLKKGIPVSYFSKGGSYFGRLQSTGHINPVRQRKQSYLGDTEFAIEFSKKIIRAKIQNQLVVMKRYAKSKNIDIAEEEKYMKIALEKINGCNTISEIMGYEGTAAKYYFKALSKSIEKEFQFAGRSRRPPMDPYNSLISLGYSIVMNEIYGIIEQKGLNPYFGFLHSDREKHPTLASDLIEEWRAVIVDATAMSVLNGHEMTTDHFMEGLDAPGCFLTKEGLKVYLKKLEKKLQTDIRYLDYVEYPVSFRRAMDLQVGCLVKAIETEDASLYTPIRIR